MRAEGLSITEIAKMYNVSSETVRFRTLKSGLYTKRQRKPLTKEEKEIVLKDKGLLSVKDCAKKNNISESMVYKVWKK